MNRGEITLKLLKDRILKSIKERQKSINNAEYTLISNKNHSEGFPVVFCVLKKEYFIYTLMGIISYIINKNFFMYIYNGFLTVTLFIFILSIFTVKSKRITDIFLYHICMKYTNRTLFI